MNITEVVKKPTGGQVKCFKLAENQALWDKYSQFKQDEAKHNNKDNKTDIKVIIAQYKPALLELEAMTGKTFNEVTAEELMTLDHNRAGKNSIHVRGFFLTCISEGFMKVSNTDLLLYLIPAEYRKLVRIMFE